MGRSGTWRGWFAPVIPGRGTDGSSALLLFGETIRPLVAPAAVWGLTRRIPVVVLDAIGAFDPYRLAREARFRGLLPAEALRRVRVARAFTCHQLARLVREGLSAELAAIPRQDGRAPKALVLLLGPCSLFYDEQVPLAERRQLFQALVAGLARLKPQAALWLLQPRRPHLVANRHFGRLLTPVVDSILELRFGPGGLYCQPRGPRLRRVAA